MNLRLSLAILGASVLYEYGAQASSSSSSRPPPAPLDSYWQVSPPLNYSDPLYAGWPQLAVDREVLVHRGTDVARTYAHHPALHYDGQHGRLYLQYSSAPIDEDATGQESWLSTSTDGGRTWSAGVSILPTALLPNQTGVGPANYTYWCDRRVYQRALHPSAWVPVPVVGGDDDDTTLYAVSQTTIRYCWGEGDQGTKAAGRVARAIDRRDGRPVGDPCWASRNEWTDAVGFPETVYGTRYGMRPCRHARQIEAYLSEPATVPAWESWLYATALYAADDAHDVQEPTNAVWFPSNDSDSSTHSRSNDGGGGGGGGGYWERFWRDISGSDIASHAVWVERTAERGGDDWYPKVKAQHGNQIFRTNIPDAGSKQHFGRLLRPGGRSGGDRFLIHNPRNNSEKLRQPLTIATSRGSGGADDGDGGGGWSPYRGIGVLRTGANTTIAPDTRGLKRLMFSYPTAVVVGGKLVVAYSENKENIWVSIVDIKNLP
ncbi:hypothetical protein SLS62_003273 [Diatrype stigma]|uniref:BT-1020-like N-terminal beta-propeller domain-containing protein n=1 Tax=Diatrype stigma TaxID=117547 RepID=A0AAN9YUS8_9PEZI